MTDVKAQVAAVQTKIDADADPTEIQRDLDDLARDIRAEGEHTFVVGIETIASAMGDAAAFDAALKAVAEFGARKLGGIEAAAHLRAWAGRVARSGPPGRGNVFRKEIGDRRR